MTQVKWTKQLGLAGALFALGMGAVWLEYKHKPAQEAHEEQEKKLFGLKDSKVQSITLNDGTGRVFEIRCSEQTATLCKPGDNSKWELAQPLKLKADDPNVNALVSSLNTLTVSETIDLKGETPEKRSALLREYGLDAQSRALASTRKVEVATPNGAKVLYLGLNHPIGDSIFALAESVPTGQKASGKVDENRVYLVPTYFKSNFDHDLTYWRDKKLMTVSSHAIESFRLDGPKAKLAGERKDGLWTLKAAQGGEFPGDIENIDNVLAAATYLTAKGFVADRKDDPKAQAALKGTRPVLTLTVTPEKGQAKEAPAPITLTLYAKPEPASAKGKAPASAGGKLYATVSNLDPLYELEPSARDRLDKEARYFRLAKLITSMERFTVKRLEVSGKPIGSPALVLKNQDGKWVAEGAKGDISGEKVQGLLDRLSGNRIQEFTPSVPAGEADGLLLKLADEKGDAKRQLAFWKVGDKLYARDLLSKRKEAFVVDPSLGEDLPKNREHFLAVPQDPKKK